ncbi:nucleoside hydrolase [Deinococcus sp. Arct2-2]|uniref:nucleoside hydrolase n=1 Tax=Deinococcus sp. Arct2-2 TaxID=2568653 RepID=UPI0010A4FD4B|nr:nucleoside hydrolase [Deinococcus sp. Arct2-2]THF66754.1 nucleoside hydrolase [Deinococcus sp. Arct2-2]
MNKVILDTDIGTDVDDILALSLLLASPELQLLGVTTAYGDTRLRAKIVHHVLAQMNLAGQVPIAPGGPATLNGEREIFWPGHEGKNIDAATIPDTVMLNQSAEDFIVETVKQHPGEITLIAIAPLANLARAIEQDPDTMRQVKQIYMMGGVFDLSRDDLPVAEHNIVSDPEAARVVFDFGLPITLFPLDVTTRTALGPAEMARLSRAAHPLGHFLHAELVNWMPYIQARHGRDYTHMHDPLTVAALLRPALVTQWLRTRVGIEVQGEFTVGMTVPHRGASQAQVNVAVGVDVPAFQELFVRRVLALGTPVIAEFH